MDQNRNPGQQQKRPQTPPERGSGGGTERNRSTDTDRDRSQSGISNRPMDEELEEQEELPERGFRQSER